LIRFGLNPLARLPASWLDGVALVFVAAGFTLAGVAACYLPAVRASKLAPSVALRDL
jgi:ABC-type lipoprotein release transport system permease subunit